MAPYLKALINGARSRMAPSTQRVSMADWAERAGIEHLTKVSSHSLRRGMATSAYRAGASFRDIKRQGGWRFDGTVQGYIDDADQFSESAVKGLLQAKSN